MRQIDCAWIPDVLHQLLHIFRRLATNDYCCDWCGLVFNLPADEPLTAAERPPRAQLAQIHFSASLRSAVPDRSPSDPCSPQTK